MKKISILISAILMMVATGCDNREDIQGQWQSGIIDLALPNSTSSTATMVMTFTQDGKVTINSEINYSEPVATVADPLNPTHISVAATATIDGTWKYVNGENDEVDLMLDSRSFSFKIDPDGVDFAATSASDSLQHTSDNLREKAIANYSAILSREMKAYFAKFSRLEDIKVSKGDNASISFEIDNRNAPDEHFTLRRI